MSDEVPDGGVHPLWLDEDVAQWLHELADKHYQGDVGLAMNDSLRAVMVAESPAQLADPWATVSYQNEQRMHGRAETPSN